MRRHNDGSKPAAEFASSGIVEDDPERMAMAGAQRADAVAEIDAIGAAHALHRPAVDREHHRIAFLQRHHRRARLHSRALLGQHEFAPFKILVGLAQKDCDLERKDMLAIDVLVKAVVIARAILQQQRGRAVLPGRMAALDERGVLGREAHVVPIAPCQRFAIGTRC